MANKTSLEKEIAQAEDRILPKQGGDSLQRRLEDYARRFEEGDDALLSQYPSELFEPTPEPLREKPVEATLEAEEGNDAPREETSLSPVVKDFTPTPLERFDYGEVKPGWVERVETRPDGTTIKHVSIDLTKIDPDEPDELDRPAFDWMPGLRAPSLRDVKRSMGL
ncbi:MAG TPA: hypothetical protein PLY09_02520 [Methanothrix sp.]|nr:hypothetical protein [Methanothrix sp.]HPJ83616.1 hypothetical protein [Methanothrix sp.]